MKDFKKAEKKLKQLILQLEDRLKKTDLSIDEASKIRRELEALKK